MFYFEKYKIGKKDSLIEKLEKCHLKCDAAIKQAELKNNNGIDVSLDDLETVIASLYNMRHIGEQIVDDIIKYS